MLTERSFAIFLSSTALPRRGEPRSPVSSAQSLVILSEASAESKDLKPPPPTVIPTERLCREWSVLASCTSLAAHRLAGALVTLLVLISQRSIFSLQNLRFCLLTERSFAIFCPPPYSLVGASRARPSKPAQKNLPCICFVFLTEKCVEHITRRSFDLPVFLWVWASAHFLHPEDSRMLCLPQNRGNKHRFLPHQRLPCVKGAVKNL